MKIRIHAERLAEQRRIQHVTRMPPKPSVSLSALVVALNRSRRRDFGAASFERKSSLGTIWLSRTGMANQE